jgi:hypothetical protein
MLPKWQLALIALLVAAGVGGGVWYSLTRYRDDASVDAKLETVTNDYRRILVLMDGADSLDEATRKRCRGAARRIFFQKQQAIEELGREIAGQPNKVGQVIRYVTGLNALTGSRRLRDADRLAFLDLFEELAGDSNTPAQGANGVPDDVRTVLEDLHSIQNTYREEVSRIFAQFATRGASGKREKWEQYMGWLRTFDSRDHILLQYNDGVR